MAITKIIGAIHPPKNGRNRYLILKNSINYVLNPNKTDGGRLTGTINCFDSSALKNMIKTKEFYGKTSSNLSERMGYHFVISWSPDEYVPHELALQITKEFCEIFLENEYECVYSVHNDHEHSHGHIVFNSVNMLTGKKFRYEDGDWERIIQPIVDNLCQKYGLHTLQMDIDADEVKNNSKSKKKSYKAKGEQGRSSNKYYNEKNEEYTKSDFLKSCIDEAILESKTYEEFIKNLKAYGFDIKVGKSEKYGEYFSIKGQGMERYRRNYILGSDYQVKLIKERIEIKDKPLPILPTIPDVKYILPYGYWKKTSYKLTPLQLKFYRAIYWCGLRKKDQKPNYYQIRQSLKKIRKLENDMRLISVFNISDNKSADDAIDVLKDELNNLSKERKMFYGDKQAYKNILTIHSEMEKAEVGYNFFLNGLSDYEEDYKRYIKLSDIIKKQGFTIEEIERYKESVDTAALEIKKKFRDIKRDIAAIESIKNEIGKEVMEHDIDVPELYSNEMEAKNQIGDINKIKKQL